MQTEATNKIAQDVALVDVRKVFRSDLLRGPQVALEKLTCRFPAGRCTGLLGHNGAGKTTTIKLILGLLKPDAGNITIGGSQISLEQKRLIGYMPEVNKLPAALTAREVLLFQLRMFAPEFAAKAAAKRDAVEAALAAVELGEHADKLVGNLSKGMARRLAWAQATIHQPRVLILDEPASGLDPLACRQMLDWIRAEKLRGTTIILCTHELAQLVTLCHQYHILRRGKLVVSGSLGPNSAQQYIVHVSGLRADGLERLAEREGLPPWRQLRQEGVLAELSFVGYEHSAHWLQTLLAHGYVVTHFGVDALAFEENLLQHFAGGT